MKSTAARVSLCIAALLASPSIAWTADCSQPVTDGETPTIEDCIYIARSSIGIVPCDTCVCDTNGSGDVRITDALRCLRFVVGGEVALDCAPCDPSTTTTMPPCASCNDVLTGAAEVENLCESSLVIYDAMRNCPCDVCTDECEGIEFCRDGQATGNTIPSTTPLACIRCVIDECRPLVLECVED